MDHYYHVFYLIEARRELADQLQGRVPPEFAKFLIKPPGYHTQENGDATWLEADRLLKVKLVFLNALRTQTLRADPHHILAKKRRK